MNSDLTGERLIELCKAGDAESLSRASGDILFKPLTAFTDKNGWTPLHHAAFMNFSDVIKILLSHGADVTRQNSFGRTALHIAADWDNDEVARLLLAHAADRPAFLALRDESGRRALDYAVSEELRDILAPPSPAVAGAAAGGAPVLRRSNTRKTTIAKPVPDEFEMERAEVSTGERIGIGGTAEVFKGVYRGTEVAVKRMHFDGKSMPAHVEAFRKEIFAMANCRHPNLVLLMGAVTRTLPLTLVTELCRGGSLYDLLYTKKLKLSRKQQLKISLDVARAINYLHTQKPMIIHRDCKSLNVLLLEPVTTGSDVPVGKLADFGAARQKQDSTMTANTGTYHWMAPEVLNGVSYDEKIDVYSFAMLMYEIFSGFVPFTEHEYLEPLQIAQAVQRGLRPGIEKVADFRAREIIEKCWQKDPTSRPDMAAVIDALLALPSE